MYKAMCSSDAKARINLNLEMLSMTDDRTYDVVPGASQSYCAMLNSQQNGASTCIDSCTASPESPGALESAERLMPKDFR